MTEPGTVTLDGLRSASSSLAAFTRVIWARRSEPGTSSVMGYSLVSPITEPLGENPNTADPARPDT